MDKILLILLSFVAISVAKEISINDSHEVEETPLDRLESQLSTTEGKQSRTTSLKVARQSPFFQNQFSRNGLFLNPGGRFPDFSRFSDGSHFGSRFSPSFGRFSSRFNNPYDSRISSTYFDRNLGFSGLRDNGFYNRGRLGYFGNGLGNSGGLSGASYYNGDGLTPSILRDDRQDFGDGSYFSSFETENGIQQEEIGTPTGPYGTVVKQGSYSFTYPDGTPATFQWVADENGFRVVSNVIPPIPEHSAAQIENARIQEELLQREGLGTGGYDSGAYREGQYDSGAYRSGHHHSGQYDSGAYHPGHHHSGQYDSGAHRLGGYNSGRYHSSLRSNSRYNPYIHQYGSNNYYN